MQQQQQKAALHQQQRVPPHKVGYGAWVAALEQLPFVLQDEPIGLRVGEEHGQLSKHVSCEYGSEPGLVSSPNRRRQISFLNLSFLTLLSLFPLSPLNCMLFPPVHSANLTRRTIQTKSMLTRAQVSIDSNWKITANTKVDAFSKLATGPATYILDKSSGGYCTNAFCYKKISKYKVVRACNGHNLCWQVFFPCSTLCWYSNYKTKYLLLRKVILTTS
ncbi:hypothetical protein ACFX13_001440 [Malus domestica]